MQFSKSWKLLLTSVSVSVHMEGDDQTLLKHVQKFRCWSLSQLFISICFTVMHSKQYIFLQSHSKRKAPWLTGKLEGLDWRFKFTSSCPLLEAIDAAEDAWEPNESCDNSWKARDQANQDWGREKRSLRLTLAYTASTQMNDQLLHLHHLRHSIAPTEVTAAQCPH